MKIIKTIGLAFSFLTMTIAVHSQNKKDSTRQAANDEKLLKELTRPSLHNVVNAQKLLIKDEKVAVTLAEVILFSVYGKEEILQQRPYNTSMLKNHWVISGSLPQGYKKGGTFLIIIDATNGKVIRITHGR